MNYIIVDDEPQARKLLQVYMADINNYQLIKVCANAMEAYETLYTTNVDLMFLDIKMPVLSGLDFLQSLKNPPMVIFTTAYNKYAMNGYDLNVVDYLLKPIALPRLLQALQKADERFKSKPAVVHLKNINHIFIKVENKLLKVNLNQVLLVEGMQNYIKIHLPGKILVAAYTMKALEDMLPKNQFLRVHRSFIVPVNTINAINGNVIETDYKDVPIGVSFKAQVMQYVINKH